MHHETQLKTSTCQKNAKEKIDKTRLSIYVKFNHFQSKKNQKIAN